MNDDDGRPNEFEKQASERPPGLIAEFIEFLRREKKWWLAPIIVVLLLVAFVAWFGSTSVAPFLYPGL